METYITRCVAVQIVQPPPRSWCLWSVDNGEAETSSLKGPRYNLGRNTKAAFRNYSSWWTEFWGIVKHSPGFQPNPRGFSCNIFRFKLSRSHRHAGVEFRDYLCGRNGCFRGAFPPRNVYTPRCSLVPQVSSSRLLTLSTSPWGSLRHLISSRECAQVTTRHRVTLCVSDDSYSIRQSACSRSFLLYPPVFHPIQSSRFKMMHSV